MKLIESLLSSPRLGRLIFPGGVEKIEKQRLLLNAFFLLLFIAILATFGVYNLFIGEIKVAAGTAIGGTSFLVCLFYLKIPRVRIYTFRFSIGVLSFFLFYLVLAGTHSGTTILWMYTLPPITFFMLGRTEGLLWVGTFMILLAFFLFWPDIFNTYQYEVPFTIRFLVSSGVSALFAYVVEMFREMSYQKLLEEKSLMEKAFEEIRVLRGILPICSFCKQIRDQEGNWRQLEAYFRECSEIDFSHSVCPNCSREHYPDLIQNR